MGIPDNAFVVGMVGRISSQKAPDVFIQMAKLVKLEISNAYFVIVGNGKQENEIENMLRKMVYRIDYISQAGLIIR